jgi:methionine biosynthesis protein MetW
MQALKNLLRNSPLRPVYLRLAEVYQGLRHLFIYPATARVDKTDYDAYWDEKFATNRGGMSAWRLRRAQAFATLVLPGDRVLDLGVGDGALLQYLIEQRGVIGYGLDVSPKAVAFCLEKGLHVDLADVNKPIGEFIREPFDYVMMSEIVEHLPEPEILLDSLRPYARKGLIVSIPNTGYYQHRLRLLFGKFPLQWVVTPGEHLRFWTRVDFHWWARQMRFEIVREIPYEGFPGLRRALPGLCAAAFVYLLRDTGMRTDQCTTLQSLQ